MHFESKISRQQADITLKFDESDRGVGAIFIQTLDGMEYAVPFPGTTLNETE